MSEGAGLRLLELPPSPNSIKVRIGLGLLQLPCELEAINPADRTRLVEVSRQPLAPVLLDGGRAIYDSFAILRYLDANFPDAPGVRLYSDDRERMRAIEGWEVHARTELQPAIGMTFGQFFAPEVDPKAIEAANAKLAEGVLKVELALQGRSWLTGEAPNAADATCAAFVHYGVLDPATQPEGSIQAFFAAHLRLAEGSPATRAWLERMRAYDVSQ